MGKAIVIQFITLDGVTEDPDGSQGFAHGGWAFRFGPQAVAGDKFKLGALLDRGTLLVGSRTWQLFSKLWPARSDPFSAKMNAIPKVVASHTLANVDAWSNSRLISGDLIDDVRRRKKRGDLIVIGSDSIIVQLREHDLIDEYRLLIFPLVLGTGRRLFPKGAAPAAFQTLSVEQSGEACLIRLAREMPSAAPESSEMVTPLSR